MEESLLLRVSPAQIAAANEKLAEAFTLLNLVKEGGGLICPECGQTNSKKVTFKRSNTTNQAYWKCYACGGNSSAPKLVSQKLDIPFWEAVLILLGEKKIEGLTLSVVSSSNFENTFVSTVDVEVYNDIQKYFKIKGIKGAIRYWSEWHISPQIVLESGSTILHAPELGIDSQELYKFLLAKYGQERLIKSGVGWERDGEIQFFFGPKYAVLEPHEYRAEWSKGRSPLSKIPGITWFQLRPIDRTKQSVEAHKAWKKRWGSKEVWEEAYKRNPKQAGMYAKYVSPFLAVKGATPQSIVGSGLRQISALPDNSTVMVVEGFKDLLAARTLGFNAYAIPGVGMTPPTKVLDVLRRHRLVLALDGDAAGDNGTENLLSYFKDNKLNVVVSKERVGGMDWADRLVYTYKRKGCTCPTCSKFKLEKAPTSR